MINDINWFYFAIIVMAFTLLMVLRKSRKKHKKLLKKQSMTMKRQKSLKEPETIKQILEEILKEVRKDKN